MDYFYYYYYCLLFATLSSLPSVRADLRGARRSGGGAVRGSPPPWATRRLSSPRRWRESSPTAFTTSPPTRRTRWSCRRSAARRRPRFVRQTHLFLTVPAFKLEQECKVWAGLMNARLLFQVPPNNRRSRGRLQLWSTQTCTPSSTSRAVFAAAQTVLPSETNYYCKLQIFFSLNC